MRASQYSNARYVLQSVDCGHYFTAQQLDRSHDGITIKVGEVQVENTRLDPGLNPLDLGEHRRRRAKQQLAAVYL